MVLGASKSKRVISLDRASVQTVDRWSGGGLFYRAKVGTPVGVSCRLYSSERAMAA